MSGGTFESLPVELIYEVFDYLSGGEVLRSFLGLNNRIDQLIWRSGLSLRTIDISQFSPQTITNWMKMSSSELLSSIVSLRFANRFSRNENSGTPTEFFFSLIIDLNRFTTQWNNLEQMIFIRPIVDLNIVVPDVFLCSFYFYSTPDRLVCRKRLDLRQIPILSLSSTDSLRPFLDNHGGIYDQWLTSFDNHDIRSVVMKVQHLKLFIDQYDKHWSHVSPLIINSLSELTVIVQDPHFLYYEGHLFSSLFPNLSEQCLLRFWLQIHLNSRLTQIDVDLLTVSFQSDFFRNHQANVRISYHDNIFRLERPLRIYTLPLCVSQLMVFENEQFSELDFSTMCLTRVTFDPCHSGHARIFGGIERNTLNLSHLNSLEFKTNDRHLRMRENLIINSINNRLIPNINHIHFNQYLQRLTTYEPSKLNLFQQVHHLDITDDIPNCSILSDIISASSFCSHILHLNITGACYLDSATIKTINRNFLSLQTLRFPVQLQSSYIDQLNTIVECFLLRINSYLRYLRVNFIRDNLLIMCMAPSENQLSEWLGCNQRRLSYLQGIVLNREEFSVWTSPISPMRRVF